MHKMTKDHNVEVYIEAFECTAIQVGLERTQWASQLGALLIGKAQAAYRALPQEEAYHYKKVKAAILYRVEMTPKHYQRLFRGKNGKKKKRGQGCCCSS